MITLPKISASPESEAANGAAFDPSSPDAGSFLALLSQAMPGPGDGNRLDPNALAPGVQKLALTANGADAAGPDAQTLLDAMLAGLETQSNARPDTAGDLRSVADKIHALAENNDLNEQDMAALSALFAMLPHQQTAALNTLDRQSATSVNVANSADRIAKALTGDARTDLKSDGKPRADAPNLNAQPAAAAAPPQTHDAPQAATHADKLFNDANASSPATPSASPALVTSASTATTPTSAAIATPHTAVLNAQLGSAEWQHAFSQQVTLFTRNGQQSAELRLNPDALGQVHISMKLDDNLAQMQFVSPHSHVRAALEAALPTLRTQLAESGIQLGQSNVSSDSFAGQPQQQGQPQQNGSRGNAFRFTGSGDEGVMAPASLQSSARGDNAVDIFA